MLGREISFGSYKTDPPAIRGRRLFERNPKAILGEFDSDVNRFGRPRARDLGNRDSTLSRLNLHRTLDASWLCSGPIMGRMTMPLSVLR